MVKNLQKVLLDVHIHCRYLHRDSEKTYSGLLKMRSCWKNICRHMNKNVGDLVKDL